MRRGSAGGDGAAGEIHSFCCAGLWLLDSALCPKPAGLIMGDDSTGARRISRGICTCWGEGLVGQQVRPVSVIRRLTV